jgi:tetratricopeptide (TPR) repeat protein
MIIANPIYDIVFKHLMANLRVAKFFISTLLNEEIESVEVSQQEFTYLKHMDKDDPEVVKYIKKTIQERLLINVLRLDFIATIKTKDGGYKKVLIEIQKAKNDLDLMRFRNYLAEQYKKQEEVGGQKMPLPITTIYILGFNLPEIDRPCVQVERQYKDAITQETLDVKSDFMEKLTHDSFVVQVDRITGNASTQLGKMLSLFEQNNFIDDRKITKGFKPVLDSEEIKIMAEILEYLASSAEERQKIEIEQEGMRTIEVMIENRRKELEEKEQALQDQEQALNKNQKALEEKDKVLDEKEQTLGNTQKALEEKDKVLEENQKALAEKEKALKEKAQALEEEQKALDENKQALSEKDRLIEALLRQLNQKP